MVDPKKELFAVEHEGAITTHESFHDSPSGGHVDTSSSFQRDTLNFGKPEPVPYGVNNDLPEELIRLVEKSTTLAPAIGKMAAMLYAGGPIFGNIEYTQAGEELLKRDFTSEESKAVRRFLRRSQVDLGLMHMANDLAFFGWFAPQVTMSNEKDPKIASIWPVHVRKLRWRIPNKNGDEVESAYISNDWPSAMADMKNFAKELPVIDAFDFDRVEKAKKLKGKSFIYRIQAPSNLGDDYYPRPTWVSANNSGWLAYALEVLEFKKWIIKNQMKIKYVIFIDVEYWEFVYPNGEWGKKTSAERKAAKEAEISNFLEKMKGKEKAGNAVIAAMKTGHDGKQYKLWEIQEMKDFAADKGGQYKEDSDEASSHILSSTGMDPSIIGWAPGKNHNTAGSGSNIRTAANLQMSLLRMFQDMLLKPLELLRDVNGLDEDYVFRFRNYVQATLDQGSSQQESK